MVPTCSPIDCTDATVTVLIGRSTSVACAMLKATVELCSHTLLGPVFALFNDCYGLDDQQLLWHGSQMAFRRLHQKLICSHPKTVSPAAAVTYYSCSGRGCFWVWAFELI